MQHSFLHMSPMRFLWDALDVCAYSQDSGHAVFRSNFCSIQAMSVMGGWEKYSDLVANIFPQKTVWSLATNRIDSAPMRDGIVSALPSYAIPALDFSFLTPHGISSRELFMAMRNQFDVQPLRLAAWRNPEERLKSAWNICIGRLFIRQDVIAIWILSDKDLVIKILSWTMLSTGVF